MDDRADAAAPGPVVGGSPGKLMAPASHCTNSVRQSEARPLTDNKSVRAGRLASGSVAVITVWDELKPVIARLLAEQPGAFASHPSLDSALVPRTPPIKIRLTPWAAGAAEERHRQFGDDVELAVGWLPYPPGRPARTRRQSAPGELPELPDLLDPDEVTVTLSEPAVLSSGHTLHHHLTVHNLTGGELQLATNGGVTAVVVDPQTRETAGGFSGVQTVPLKIYRVAPGGSTSIPLLTGTASSRPELGYAVPPGEWGIQVTLTLGPHPIHSPRRRTPILPLTVTA